MKPDASGNLTQARALAEWPLAFWDARWGIVNIALIGIFFGVCYLKTGSLWFPIGFHAAWNFFLGCIFSLPVSGIKTFRLLDVGTVANTSATGGDFGAEGSVFLVAILAALLWLLRRQNDHPQALSDLGALTPQREMSAQANTTEEQPVEEDSEEYTPSRFRTSMRPAAPRPTLQIDNAPSPNAFTPAAPGGFADALQPSTNTVLAPEQFTTDVTEQARTVEEPRLEKEPFTPVVATAPEREAASSPRSSTRLEPQPQNLGIAASVTEPIPVETALTEPTPQQEPAPVTEPVAVPEVAPRPVAPTSPTTPKKPKPKW
jgi:hypothetical protein